MPLPRPPSLESGFAATGVQANLLPPALGDSGGPAQVRGAAGVIAPTQSAASAAKTNRPIMDCMKVLKTS